MRRSIIWLPLLLAVAGTTVLTGIHATAASPKPSKPVASPPGTVAQYSESDYLLAVGRGDLSSGPLVCERVADTVARAEVAKQIRVFIEETLTDRQRERSGQPFQQDIEIVLKETTSELLQDVQIVARTVDRPTNTCTSTAVMPKSRITQKMAPSPNKAQPTP